MRRMPIAAVVFFATVLTLALPVRAAALQRLHSATFPAAMIYETTPSFVDFWQRLEFTGDRERLSGAVTLSTTGQFSDNESDSTLSEVAGVVDVSTGSIRGTWSTTTVRNPGGLHGTRRVLGEPQLGDLRRVPARLGGRRARAVWRGLLPRGLPGRVERSAYSDDRPGAAA